jgi:hypothetical protein
VVQLVRRRHLERQRTGMTRCGLKLNQETGMAMWDELVDSVLGFSILSTYYRLHESFIFENFRDEAPGKG